MEKFRPSSKFTEIIELFDISSHLKTPVQVWEREEGEDFKNKRDFVIKSIDMENAELVLENCPGQNRLPPLNDTTLYFCSPTIPLLFKHRGVSNTESELYVPIPEYAHVKERRRFIRTNVENQSPEVELELVRQNKSMKYDIYDISLKGFAFITGPNGVFYLSIGDTIKVYSMGSHRAPSPLAALVRNIIKMDDSEKASYRVGCELEEVLPQEVMNLFID